MTRSLLVKTTLNLCSCFVPYLGARSNYAAFLDQLFEINMKKLMNEDLEEVVKNRILTINTYIFNFNVSKKNINLELQRCGTLEFLALVGAGVEHAQGLRTGGGGLEREGERLLGDRSVPAVDRAHHRGDVPVAREQDELLQGREGLR